MALDPPSVPSRNQRLRISGQFWLLGIAVLALLCWQYGDSARPPTLRGAFFLRAGALSCAASLSFLPGILGLLAALWVRSRPLLGLVSAFLWTLTLLAVYVDTRIYEIFRYHFNGLVWNVLTTPGADEAVHLSGREVALVLGTFAALIPVQYAAFRGLWNWNLRRAELGLPVPRMARPTRVWAFLLVPVMLLVAGLYAWSDMRRDPHVMAFARVYPLYPRLTIKRFAQRHLGVVMKERPEVDLPASGILLSYPHEMPVLPGDGPTPNVLIVVIDSLRDDMLVPEVMPNVSALAERARTFTDHLSSGNATRFGLFGMIYGLHGSYWRPIYSEHRSPVLVDALLARGYDFRVLTSASMDFPEFRSTAWVRVEKSVEDRLPAERPGGRDDGVATRFEQWMGERDPAAPFFAFLLLDAPHQSYSFPSDCAVFEPYLDEVAYSAIDEGAPERVRTGLFNRYRNAVHYADRTTGRILEALRARGLAEDTVVVVTGDHGEEFFENGFWGHTSNFTRAQVHVPFVLAGPGVPPGVETRPTCHIDLPGTLLELLGADPGSRSRWTLGESLLAPKESRVRVASGWSTLGLHVPGAILEIPMAGYGGTEIAVYDMGWRPYFEDAVLLERQARELAALALDCRLFLR